MIVLQDQIRSLFIFFLFIIQIFYQFYIVFSFSFCFFLVSFYFFQFRFVFFLFLFFLFFNFFYFIFTLYHQHFARNPMTFGTLRKPTQPFNTLQEHTTTFFSNFESSRMQVFASFCKVSFYLFFRFMFFVFVFFIFINLFYSGTLRKPSTISELQKHELEMEIWGFVYFFIQFAYIFVFCLFFFLLIFNFILFYLSLTSFGTMQENDLTFPALYKNTNSNISGTLQKVMNMSEYNRI